MSLAVARIINWMHATMKPLIWVMNHASNGLLWVFGQRDLAGHGEGHFSMTGDEIRTVLSASEQEGVLDPQLTMMLRGVFDLDEHTARDAMIPRTEVDAVEHTSTVADVLDLFKEELRERYPVYETSLDNIVGVVSMKQHKWEKKTLQGTELYEKTLGIIGCGRIGLEVAKRALAFGMNVLAYDIIQVETNLPLKQVSLEELLSQADIITLHVPKQAQPILGEAEFQKMKEPRFQTDILT